MKKKLLKPRDKLFWICVGLGSVIAGYFSYIYFFDTSSNSADFEKYVFEKKYELYVPAYFLADDSLYEKADLQFSDYSHEVFLVLVKENKTDLLKQGLRPTIKEYALYIQSTIGGALQNTKVELLKEDTINGLGSVTCELSGTYGGHAVYYIFTVLDGSDTFYQVISWTTKTLKQDVKKDIYATIQSFKIL